MRVYLDNCCFNRPYDDQSQLRISLETQAKLQIQSLIKLGEIELASSYVLLYENSRNPHTVRKDTIRRFIKDYIGVYVDVDNAVVIKEIADSIIATGVKTVDAFHLAAAILSESDYFLTTDDRLLKYQTDKLKVTDPTSFIREWEVYNNE